MTADVHFNPPPLQSKLQSTSGGSGRPVATSGGRRESDRVLAKSREGSGPMLARMAVPGSLASEWHLSGPGPVTHRKAVDGTWRRPSRCSAGKTGDGWGHRDHWARWSALARPLPTGWHGLSAGAHRRWNSDTHEVLRRGCRVGEVVGMSDPHRVVRIRPNKDDLQRRARP